MPWYATLLTESRTASPERSTARTNTRGICEAGMARGLPIFVTGGGSGPDLYRRAIDAVQIENEAKVGFVEPLPVH